MEFAYHLTLHKYDDPDFAYLLRVIRDAGFDKVALAFFDPKLFFQLDWEHRVGELREEIEMLGLRVDQTHLPCYPLDSSSEQRTDEMEVGMQRALQASAILGAKWGVCHTRTSFTDDCKVETSLKDNRESFSALLEISEKCGVGISIENTPLVEHMFPGQHLFGTNPAELCELVDQLQSEKASICLDTGHAHMLEKQYPQADSVRMFGKRLKTVHLHDNPGYDDAHAIPLCGTINWPKLLAAFGDIGFDGSMAFETVRCDPCPGAWKPFIEATYAVGQHMRQWLPECRLEKN